MAEEDASSAVQALLDVQTQAVLSGDKQAFLATIDPQASEAFHKAQELSFDGWHSLPLSSFSLRARAEDSGDLAPGLHLTEFHKAEASYMSETRRIYQFADYDEKPAFDSQWITYVKRSGRWYAASDGDAEVIGLSSERQLWDFGRMTAQKTPHFLVLSQPNQTDRGKALGVIAENAMTAFQSRWSLPWSQRIPLLVPGSQQQLREALRISSDVSNFSAFVTYTPYREGGWKTTAPRMYAQEASLAGVSVKAQTETIVHELTHAASVGISGPFTPVWMHEGLAEWERLGRPADYPSPNDAPAKLPKDEDFSSKDPLALRRAYTLATSATANISKKVGITGPPSLFQAVGNRRDIPGSASYNTNAAFKETLSKSIEDFQSTWAK